MARSVELSRADFWRIWGVAALLSMFALFAIAPRAQADEDLASASAFWRQEATLRRAPPPPPRAAQSARRGFRRHAVASAVVGLSIGGTTGSNVLAEAQRWMGHGNMTGTRGPWCRDFVNFVLRRTGHRAEPSRLAITAIDLGPRVAGPMPGAIAVMRSHVGFVEGMDRRGDPIIISGNHGHRVGVGVYPRRRVVAYVMPE